MTEQHAASVKPELRDLPPVNGWRRVERTGQARTTCLCGLDTGLIPFAVARATADAHVQL